MEKDICSLEKDIILLDNKIAELEKRIVVLEEKAHYKTLEEACREHTIAMHLLPKEK